MTLFFKKALFFCLFCRNHSINNEGGSSSISSSTTSTTSSSSDASMNGSSASGSVTTPCTPGDPLTHYHHKNNDHYVGAFAIMNRMRINSQVNDPFHNLRRDMCTLHTQKCVRDIDHICCPYGIREPSLLLEL